MYGTSQGIHAQDLPRQQRDSQQKFGAGTLYVPIVRDQAATWPGSQNKLATVDRFGRGLLASSNKPSEHNIWNMPIFFASLQLPPQKQAQQLVRNWTWAIPPPLASGNPYTAGY